MQPIELRRSRQGQALAPRSGFLPTCREDLEQRGWDGIDILIVTGDAYVDHPAFGPVLIARFLEGRGYRVGLLAQPDWRSPEALTVMGTPRLFVGVSAGNLDSMLNKLTAQKKVRSDDQYSPGGQTGRRPNRATIVYSNLCRQAFGDVPIVLGGIEASLRRIAHYDYWMDQVRRSILLDAKADLLVYGMGERPALEIARRLARGESVKSLQDIRGTGFVMSRPEEWEPFACDPSRFVTDGKTVVLPSYEQVCESRLEFARMSGLLQRETNPGNARPLLQVHGKQAVYFNPPAMPLEEADMDELYDLPFQRQSHPSNGAPVPAFETVKHSIVTMRGCFGGCSFCSITEHEGRVIQSRSAASVLREVRALSRMDGFRGVISDLGGPTANMYQMRCKSDEIETACRRLSCVHPKICENLNVDHGPLIELMRQVRTEPGIKHAFIASGIRYDLASRSPEFIRELARHHTGGQLSVAPEHNDPEVLDRMKKPAIEHYERFAQAFCDASAAAGKEQYLIPYLISGHPGSTIADTIELARYLKRSGLRPRQVQDFIPTPMAMATAMYYSGHDPITLEPVTTVHSLREKRQMKALLLYWDSTQWALAREALERAGRRDLIGWATHCLVPPAGAEERAGAAEPNRSRTVGHDRAAGRSAGSGNERRRPAPGAPHQQGAGGHPRREPSRDRSGSVARGHSRGSVGSSGAGPRPTSGRPAGPRAATPRGAGTASGRRSSRAPGARR